ncbi:zinc-binding dehydrogenase [Haloarcula sp. 1CSR25-25]|uniref:zinc-binding dehydrogenase n=1 Tax=Haloarcula sp. 1CSR25-25 TaxID=2862545 RepID=UPI00289B3FF9|nr:zinc-binding dehydrogenase [Haloarcula sp. 1CSR25-25]
MALLGCCASTGVGSVLSTATVEPASSVAVFGCGGVGMSAVLGGVTVGASPLVAVDMATNRLEMAAELGATHTVDPRSADVVEHVVDLTHGGADYTFECSGNQQAGEQALAATRKGGTVVMVGGGDPENSLSVHPNRDLVPGGKTIVGSVAGSLRPHEDIPRYARLCADGHLNLDALITHRYDLSKLPSAFETMAAGAGVRGVVTFD